ncbi:undecaprenyldiphospho-muramoylpentapeptide beta-N-acetylglucosaminyltransferase [Alkalicaulis satelles]|uniref:UDP-N-acetylglucosamine--N-acetylmuramyl-(pentapeptide) pyrophosphoryl-undecaprenol N-acetylglucosamine transferase n=1 Tax=Alkalicaulis satelles TaxID=2609175 RepID=A0A5M6ZLT6_9PROT|nr:undecaprenyldiphospho-muramoylpentapeptide beta-N-acetylglucosaminyltransferase [Alkalicaulis satelles]KAA5805290.1 undecaprenyldiphospho-muramoylpentapeptide beta-N-acetylglucosaminyltransferase [Alkalicaulis satelles]
MSARRLIIAAGGTGGHIFPARAAAETLIARGWQVALITDARGARHTGDFPGEGVSVIRASSPFQSNPLRLPGALADLASGMMATRKLLKAFGADVAAGFGGYPAFPLLAAARLSGLPFVIHEQNAVLGRVNRLFAGSAHSVASGFDRLDRLPARARHAVTGNPVRAHVLSARAAPYAAPARDGEIRLLVLGGSLGARILSETVPEAVALLPEALRQRLSVVQQTRQDSLERARAVYDAAGVKAELSPFFDDMGARYGQAHLVISRAGASSVSELAAIGRPAILVPLAIAMDDHQSANAQGLAHAGGAEVMAERDVTAQSLSQRLETLLADGEALAARAAAARAAGRPDAHEALADLIERAAE